MNVMYVTCYLHTPFYKYILMQFLCIVKFWQYKVYMLLDNKRNEKKKKKFLPVIVLMISMFELDRCK